MFSVKDAVVFLQSMHRKKIKYPLYTFFIGE
jgi:hypothetical protein